MIYVHIVDLFVPQSLDAGIEACNVISNKIRLWWPGLSFCMQEHTCNTDGA